MASDLLSRLGAMARGEHDDLSVAAEAAEEIRRLAAERAAAWRAGMEEAASVAEGWHKDYQVATKKPDGTPRLRFILPEVQGHVRGACRFIAEDIRAKIKEKAGE